MSYFDKPESDPKMARWSVFPTPTGTARLALARAFVMNPEVLMMHKPLEPFDEEDKDKILGLLRSFVDDRGLALPDWERRLRRPRTLFFTSEHVNWIARSTEYAGADRYFDVRNTRLTEFTP